MEGGGGLENFTMLGDINVYRERSEESLKNLEAILVVIQNSVCLQSGTFIIEIIYGMLRKMYSLNERPLSPQ